jgi:DNA-directed RNA polymerase subunit K/omega
MVVDQELDVTPVVPERPQADEKYAVNPTAARFLFVEIAAQRAKQLRRGALNRLQPVEPAEEAAPAEAPAPAHKAERVAMEEVKRGYIKYELADEPPSHPKVEGLL